MFILRAFFALILLLTSLPLLFICFILIKLTSQGPFIYKQVRIGKNKKPFIIYKIRTMVHNADKLRPKLIKLNEAKGPVFKIKNDPRFTKIGKFLSHTGLDELPQLVNIIKGEMAFVGPRPLPKDEALKIPFKYKARFSVLPGITSEWVIRGKHKLTFKQWMKLDLEYAQNSQFKKSLVTLFNSILLILNLVYKKLTGRYEK